MNSPSRALFIEQIESIEKVLSDPIAIDLGPNSIEHNRAARIVRNGTAISLFNTLETFIRTRSFEVSKRLASLGIPFSHFGEKFQKAMTVEALNGVVAQTKLKRQEPIEQIKYLIAESAAIGGLNNTSYSFSGASFFSKKSNIGKSDIGEQLKIFNIEDSWKKISQISSLAGFASIDKCSSFNKLLQLRNRAAHNSLTQISSSEITSLIDESFAIGLGFDALISNSYLRFSLMDPEFISGNTKIELTDIKFVRILKVGGKWKEYRDGKKKAAKISSDFNNALLSCCPRAAAKKEIIVRQGTNSKATGWFIPNA